MPWTTPLTAVANNPLTAAQWNASVRDNFLETAPGKATTASRFFVTTGVNSIAERVLDQGTAPATVSTTNNGYVALTGGPTATCTTGVLAVVAFGCTLANNTAGSNSFASYQVAGATTVAAADSWAMGQAASGSARPMAASRVRLHTALNPGSNAFTMMYRVSATTGDFTDRHIMVIPF